MCVGFLLAGHGPGRLCSPHFSHALYMTESIPTAQGDCITVYEVLFNVFRDYGQYNNNY